MIHFVTSMEVKRRVWMILLLLGGSTSILYGWVFHTVTVEVEKERQISIAVPVPSDFTASPFGQPSFRPSRKKPVSGDDRDSDDVDPFQSPSDDGSNPFEPPSDMPAPPGMKMEKVTEKYTEDLVVPEDVIVEDATVGGVVRLANGKLKRTYSGKMPSLCPT